MALDVKCDVSNCVYNEATKCNASAIKVSNNNCNKAEVAGETECDTFQCK